MDVLVVDDEADIRALLEMYLRGRGHEPTVVGDAAGARRACLEQAFDVGLFDVSLPDEEGPELVRSLRDEGRLPGQVVLLSALRPVELEQRAAGLGVVCVHKPFTIADLDRHLADVLAP